MNDITSRETARYEADLAKRLQQYHQSKMLSFEDAAGIREILENVLEYINEVGPRDLRNHKTELERYIQILPEIE